MFGIKTKKSAGVRVTSSTHRSISRGNAARSMGEWGKAADFYREALEEDPSLQHIWIQWGHAASEAGRWTESADAYHEAMARGAERGAAYLYLAHMLKRAGNPSASATAYLEAARAGNSDALTELNTRVGRLIPIDRSILKRAIEHRGPADQPIVDSNAAIRALESLSTADADPRVGQIVSTLLQTIEAATEGDRDRAGSKLAISYDISDLVAHFRNHRLPTGIQRVQIEVLSRALLDRSCVSRICCFANGNETLVEIPVEIFEELALLARLGTNSQEPIWVEAVARLFLHLAIAPEYQFVQDECLVNLGTSWWIYNYFLFVRNAKSRLRIRFATIVFDLVPLLATEHCIRGISEDYVGWLVGAFRHTDHFLAISKSTGDDLVRAAQRLGYASAAEKVTIIPLDTDFRRPGGKASPLSALAAWNLAHREYALFVSTIESRKNHALVLDAWAELLRRGDLPNLPQLVFVGRNGWLNDQVFSRLAANAHLRQYVTIIERASDEDLALLYRACLFTVYPSLYEGWGLPITEALCYGKVPVVADNSSLTEAGGDFALFFESNSVPALVAAITKIVSEPAWRIAQERRIESDFAPRPWSAVSDQVIAVAKSLAQQPSSGWTPPLAEPGKYYPVSRYRGVRIWKGLEDGEMFRFGDGWHWPEESGSRMRPAGGELQFTLPAGDGPWRLYLRLHGLDGEECPYEITIGDTVLGSGSLLPRECRWARGVSFSAPGGQPLSIHVRGLLSEPVELMQGGSLKPRVASIGVAGFYLFPVGDEEAYHQLLEASALNRLEEISAYREG